MSNISKALILGYITGIIAHILIVLSCVPMIRYHVLNLDDVQYCNRPGFFMKYYGNGNLFSYTSLPVIMLAIIICTIAWLLFFFLPEGLLKKILKYLAIILFIIMIPILAFS